MTTGDLPFNPRLAHLVSTDTLVPFQRKTKLNFQTATDFYQQDLIKHPYRSDFHSYAEYLHAGLLEGNPKVTCHVPQPFLFRIRQKWYTPDSYVVEDNQPRKVVELKPRGEFADDKRIPLEHFCAQHGMEFIVVSNESVYERETEALNWLEIVRCLYQGRDLSTEYQEECVFDALRAKACCAIGDLVDPGDRETSYLTELAIYRLLHQGHLTGQLTENPLDWNTEVAL